MLTSNNNNNINNTEVVKRNPPLVMLRNKKGVNSNNELASSSSSSSVTSSQSNHKHSSTKSENRNSVSLKHYDCLLGELKCPGCSKPMQAPIKLCESGHSICNYCTKQLLMCPLCKKSFTENRSITLEAIVAKAYFNCSNIGCTVRLPLELMKWHKKRCVYQVGDCFMGKVWGNCKWMGCEKDWMNHCLENHADKIWFNSDVTTIWTIKHDEDPKPVKGYYIFKVFNETFNLYHIYDKPARKVIWTLICASKEPKLNQRFVFEIEIFVSNDPTRLMIQRNSCHAEHDEDILDEMRCITYNIGDLMRFMDDEKNLHYRIKIIELDYLKSTPPILTRSISNSIPIDYNLTSNALCNTKNIPTTNIITRKSCNDELCKSSTEINSNDAYEIKTTTSISSSIISNENNNMNKKTQKTDTIEKEIISINDLKRIFMMTNTTKDFKIDNKLDEILEKEKSKQISSSN